jgi:WD40 repeat protein
MQVQTGQRANWWWMLLVVGVFVVTGQQTRGQQAEPFLTLRGHRDGTSALAFARDGRMLASGSRLGVVKLWELTSGRERATLGDFGDTVYSLSMLWKGDKLRVRTRHHVLLRGSLFFVPHDLDMSFGPRQWEVRSGAIPTRRPCGPPKNKERLARRGTAGDIYAVSLSPDGRTEVTAERGGAITLWETASGKPRTSFKSGQWGVRSVAFSSDGKQFASAGSCGTIRLWELGTGKARATLKGHTNSVYAVAFTRGDNILVSGGSDGNVVFWDTRTGTRLFTLKLGGPVFAVAISPDGRFLATGGYQGKIEIWSVAQLLAPGRERQ